MTTAIAGRESAPSLMGQGIYTIPEASRLSGVPMRGILRWTRSYSFV